MSTPSSGTIQSLSNFKPPSLISTQSDKAPNTPSSSNDNPSVCSTPRYRSDSSASQNQRPNLLVLSYENHMWDRLNQIVTSGKRGQEVLSALRTFSAAYAPLVAAFTTGIRAATDQLDTDLKKAHSSQSLAGEKSKPEENYTTVAQAVTAVMTGLETLSCVLDETVSFNQLLNDFDTQINEYSQQNQDNFSSAFPVWQQLMQKDTERRSKKEKYFEKKDLAERASVKMQEALVAQQNGLLKLDKVEKVTTKGIEAKLQAEAAHQEYIKALAATNQVVTALPDNYQPHLRGLEKAERERILFVQKALQQLVGKMIEFGVKMKDCASKVQEQVSLIVPETDIKIMIKAHKSDIEFPVKLEPAQYELPADLLKQKNELHTKIILGQTEVDSEEDESTSGSSANPNGRRFSGKEARDPSKATNVSPEERVNRTFMKVFQDHQIITQDEVTYLVEAVKLPAVRQQMALCLEAIVGPARVRDEMCLQRLGKVVTAFLDCLQLQLDSKEKGDTKQQASTTQGMKELHSVIQASYFVFYFEKQQQQQIAAGENEETKQMVCSPKEQQRIYLATQISDHPIWQNVEAWRQCIHKIINQKFSEAAQIHVTKHSEPAQSAANKAKFSRFFSSSNDLTASGKDANEHPKTPSQQKPSTINKTMAQNICFNALSQFIGYFVNLKLGFDESRDLLMVFCRKYELDQARTHNLLSELESSQKNFGFQMSMEQIKNMYTQRINKQNEKYQNSENLMILGFVVSWIDCDKTLAELLVVSKQGHKVLKHSVYKQALLVSQPERLKEKRLGIWSHLLNLKENQPLQKSQQNNSEQQSESEQQQNQQQPINIYNHCKEQVLQNPQLIQNVEEVIRLDVQRSIHCMPGIESDSLNAVLKAYALFNPEIEYCQGMNFVCGFLMMIYKSEEATFNKIFSLCI